MRTTFRVAVLMTLLAVVPVAAQESGNSLLQDLLQAARLPTILEAHGMTGESFQDLPYKIAQDPELTKAYEAARTGSS